MLQYINCESINMTSSKRCIIEYQNCYVLSFFKIASNIDLIFSQKLLKTNKFILNWNFFLYVLFFSFHVHTDDICSVHCDAPHVYKAILRAMLLYTVEGYYLSNVYNNNRKLHLPFTQLPIVFIVCCIAQLVESWRPNLLDPGSNP